MTTRARWSTVLALVLVVSACRRTTEPVDIQASGHAPTDETRATDTLRLYFPGDDGKLHGEARDIERGSAVEERVARMVEALATGPIGRPGWSPLPDLVPPITDPAAGAAPPEGETTEASAEGEAELPPRVRVYLIESTVYVDMARPAGPPAVGARQELLMLYSLVNTVLLNTPEASRLVVLWNGRQPETFAGHIDTARPLAARPSLIAEPTT